MECYPAALPIQANSRHRGTDTEPFPDWEQPIYGVEAEIADDPALYFKEGNSFRTMIVYIYDDRDKPEPEKYRAIRDALKRRSDRIVDVVILQRPSMVPDRDEREHG